MICSILHLGSWSNFLGPTSLFNELWHKKLITEEQIYLVKDEVQKADTREAKDAIVSDFLATRMENPQIGEFGLSH